MRYATRGRPEWSASFLTTTSLALVLGVFLGAPGLAEAPAGKTYFTALVGLDQPYSSTLACLRFRAEDVCLDDSRCGRWWRSTPQGSRPLIALEIEWERDGKSIRVGGDAWIDGPRKTSSLGGTGTVSVRGEDTVRRIAMAGRAIGRKKCARLLAEPPESCGPFPDWTVSPYVLPYPPGEGFVIDQSNCSGFGHSDFWRYGYDFVMPIGTTITAARAGRVIHSLGAASDGDRSRTNLVTIEHADGTLALYSHLTRQGNLVTVGQLVEQGDEIGLSGDTGNTGGLPHLHFSVHPCAELPGLPGPGSCPSQPMTFRNTVANPTGLVVGMYYESQAYNPNE